jgi:hypothetical protein
MADPAKALVPRIGDRTWCGYLGLPAWRRLIRNVLVRACPSSSRSSSSTMSRRWATAASGPSNGPMKTPRCRPAARWYTYHPSLLGPGWACAGIERSGRRTTSTDMSAGGLRRAMLSVMAIIDRGPPFGQVPFVDTAFDMALRNSSSPRGNVRSSATSLTPAGSWTRIARVPRRAASRPAPSCPPVSSSSTR